MKEGAYFKENQWFAKQKWFYIVLVLTLSVSALVIYAQTIAKGVAPDWSGIIIGGGVPLVIIFGLWFSLHIITEITSTTIKAGLMPLFFFNKTIQWTEVKTCYLRDYNLFKEFGSPGMRTRGKYGLAMDLNDIGYIAKGTKGLQLELKNGKKIFVSTTKPDELKKFLKNARISCFRAT